MTALQGRVLILGLGNPLMGDDGAGIYAARALSEMDLPENVTVLEAGTPGWGLVNWLRDWPSVILLDAVRMGRRPGEWRRFEVEEVRLIASQRMLSLHESDLAGGLALAEALDLLPERIVLYGIEPENTDQTLSLSPVVGAAIPALARSILNELVKQDDERENHEPETNPARG